MSGSFNIKEDTLKNKFIYNEKVDDIVLIP